MSQNSEPESETEGAEEIYGSPGGELSFSLSIKMEGPADRPLRGYLRASPTIKDEPGKNAALRTGSYRVISDFARNREDIAEWVARRSPITALSEFDRAPDADSILGVRNALMSLANQLRGLDRNESED